MTKLASAVPGSAVISFFVFGAMSAVGLAEDLSKYRNFQLGMDLSTVAKQAGVNPSQAKVIHRRPALIEDLEWRPRPTGPSSQAESANEVVFSFYDGELFRIMIHYDRYETEGLTSDDLVEAVSATYGTAAKPLAPEEAAREPYGDREEVLARWQDPQYRFELIRSSYGPRFRLMGVLKRLEAPAHAAILEARRLDDQEAPEREAARIACDDHAARAKLEKARLANKPKFRP